MADFRTGCRRFGANHELAALAGLDRADQATKLRQKLFLACKRASHANELRGFGGGCRFKILSEENHTAVGQFTWALNQAGRVMLPCESGELCAVIVNRV